MAQRPPLAASASVDSKHQSATGLRGSSPAPSLSNLTGALSKRFTGFTVSKTSIAIAPKIVIAVISLSFVVVEC
jgi:hypothetical protein